jgi:glycosyltransferase involved in cell wall biosynthesis
MQNQERQDLKIALVHDWLLGVGGAEKTLKALHEMFPQAPIHTLFYDKKFTDSFLPGAQIRPTFLQSFYTMFKSHKLLTPILPTAVESIDLAGFDLVISSSVSFAKGLILKPQTRHICYCYSPMRQVWDWHAEYKRESRMPVFITSWSQHFLRIWDRQASTRADHFIAISENVRQRIKKYYQRESVVIYPPVAFSQIINSRPAHAGQYFLIVSRLFKHKNIEIAVRAFNKLKLPLIVIGSGPELKKLRKIAEPNVKLLGYLSDETVVNYYADCSAFIMPQEEDFGIAPLEAMTYGKPVLALARGGALEYIEEGVNGELFEDPTEEVLADGVRRLIGNLANYDSDVIKKTAERFSENKFKTQIADFLSALAN